MSVVFNVLGAIYRARRDAEDCGCVFDGNAIWRLLSMLVYPMRQRRHFRSTLGTLGKFRTLAVIPFSGNYNFTLAFDSHLRTETTAENFTMPPCFSACRQTGDLVTVSHLYQGRNCTSFIVEGRSSLDFLLQELSLVGFRETAVDPPNGYPGEDVFKVFVFHTRGRKPQDIAALLKRFAKVR